MIDNRGERTFGEEAKAIVDRAVAALRAGQRAKARRLLAAALCADPHDAAAWHLLSYCVDDEQQRRECAERAHLLEGRFGIVESELIPDGPGELARQEAGLSSIAGPRRTPAVQVAEPSLAEPQPAPVADLWLALEGVTAGTMQDPTGTERAMSHDKPPRASAHPRRRWVSVSLIGVLVALALLTASLLSGPNANARSSAGQVGTTGRLQASGVIRAEEVVVASEHGGRVAVMSVREGQGISAGEVLVRLDTALLDAQIKAAEAAVELARARLLQVKAGARSGQVAVAQAQLAQAEAVRVAAAQAVSDTAVLVANPQDVQMRIAVTQEQIKAAQLEIDRALAIKDAAEVARDAFRDAQEAIMDAGGPGTRRVRVPGAPPGTYYEYTVPSLPLQMHLAPNQWWQAWVGVNAAAAQKEGLEASLSNLYARRTDPQRLEADLAQAIARLAQAEAQVLAARAQVEWLQAGATPEQVAALEARVAQNQAALDSLYSRRSMMEIASPVDGVVISLTAHDGEVAAPGSALLTVADLSEVNLKVYLPETQIGRVGLGQRAQATVDSFPGRLFEGQVTHIADSAEFTPRNVATQEERVNLVFAVEITLSNDDGALKLGMPADAAFDGT